MSRANKDCVSFLVLFLMIGFIGNGSFHLNASADIEEQSTGGEKTTDVFDLSLEDLLNIRITSASNKSEKLSEAPATMLVITREDIMDRGYSSTMDILNDLPGMDVIFNYGDNYFKSYWRGFRNNIGAPYLFMIDGVVFNHLYTNGAENMASVPLSNLERVEIVYGPASSVYGANAFMGVINFITIKDTKNSEDSVIRAKAGLSSHKTYVGDVNVFYKKNNIRLSLTGRFEEGNVRDQGSNERFEYSKDIYFANRTLWGGFVDNSNLGGQFSSPINQRAADFRAYLGDTELAVQYNLLNTGYGYTYPGDKAQNNAVWKLEEKSIYLRHMMAITKNIASKTLLRYRESNIPGDSYYVENYKGYVDFSYWEALNSSLSFYQDFDVTATNRFSFLLGVKYEQKDLQKNYNTQYGPSLLPGDVDAGSYPFPQAPSGVKQNQNRITTRDKGVYVQSKYSFSDNHFLHLGIRLDNNSKYGNATTVRAGYVGKFGKLIVKALYGEGFQEPNPRLLYGGWQGSGSDPDLKPEKSQTVEISLNYTSGKISNLLSAYYVKNTDTILNLAGVAKNIGKRNVYGLDYHFNLALQPKFMKRLNVWAYYSYITGKGDELHPQGVFSWDYIGDLANHKFFLGITGKVSDRLTANLRGRFIGERKTVQTNPVKSVDSYVTVDMNLDYKVTKKLAVALSVTNLLDARYYHPGIRTAASGVDAGEWETNKWVGSRDWYNSLIPQPSRAFMISLIYRE